MLPLSINAAVEEMKIAQPETCEKYFIYYKQNFERPPRGNTLKLTRVMWKSRNQSSIDRLLVFLIVYPFILTHLKKSTDFTRHVHTASRLF